MRGVAFWENRSCWKVQTARREEPRIAGVVDLVLTSLVLPDHNNVNDREAPIPDLHFQHGINS